MPPGDPLPPGPLPPGASPADPPLPQRTVKVCLIGNAAVGKTSLRHRLFTGAFTQAYRTTVGADFLSKTVRLPGCPPVALAVWDTAGQERFRSLASAFYRGSDACILVYSTTDPASLLALPSWFDEFALKCPVPDDQRRSFTFVAVGNKVDLLPAASDDTTVSAEDAERILRDLLPPEPPSSGGPPPAGQANGYSIPGSDDTFNEDPTKRPSTSLPLAHSCRATPLRPPTATQINVLPPPPASPELSLPPAPPPTQVERIKHLSSASTAGSATTAYHTPSSSFHSTRSETTVTALPSPPASTPSSSFGGDDDDDDDDDDDPEENTTPEDDMYFIIDEARSASERAREKANGVDSFMASSPPRTPKSLRQPSTAYHRNATDLLLAQSTLVPPPPVPPEADEDGAPDEDTHEYEKDGIKLFLTSAKTGEGVSDVLEYVVKSVLARLRKQEAEDAAAAAAARSEVVTVGDDDSKRSKFRQACCS